MPRLVLLSTVVVGLLALAGCIAPDGSLEGGESQLIEAHNPEAQADGTVSLALVRDGKGPFYAGAVERFHLSIEGETTGAPAWAATGGQLEVAGDVVAWTLPDASQRASLEVTVHNLQGEPVLGRFHIGITGAFGDPAWLVDPAAEGLIDPTEDSVGACRLAIDSGDTPHVVYRNETHRQLWYATWTGSAWSLDMIDGPGFDTGGEVSSQVDLVVTTSGTPHVAYRYMNTDDVRYATLSGPSWTRELANPGHIASGNYGFDIELDPVNGNRPTIAFNSDESSYPRPAVTFRTGSNSWTDTTYTGTTYYYDYYAGGLEFTSSGMAWMVFKPADLHVLNWSASGGFSGDADITDSGFGDTGLVQVVLDNLGQPIVGHAEGLEHYVSAAWNHSDYEVSDSDLFGLAEHNGSPRIGVRHGQLELLDLDSENFWIYTVIDDMDSSDRPSVAVDSSGVTHACYIKDDQVWFY
jgi:hypothetical protein